MDNLRSALLWNLFLVSSLILTMFFNGQLVYAQMSADSGIEGDQEHWSVGFARFKGEDLLDENMRFTYAVPVDLFQPVLRCPFHFLDKEEINGSREQYKRQELIQLENKLHSLLVQRATEFIEQEVDATDDNLKELEREIEAQRIKIQKLKSKPASGWKVPSQQRVVLSEHNQEGELYDPPQLPLKLWTEEKDLDCLIQGRIEPLEELLYIEVRAYLRATNQSRIIYRDSFFPRESEKLVNDITKALRTFLYGRQWADITMEVEPVTAEVYVDGAAAELDETGTIRYLEPGLHSIEVREPGYIAQSVLIDVNAGSTEEVQLLLEKENPQTWLIKSEPSGADVFLESRQVGRTPLLLKEQVPPSSVLISKEGYSDRLYVMEGESTGLTAHLHPTAIDIDAVVENSRNRFYRGLAAFLFSLPLSVISYGQSSEYAYAYNSAIVDPSISSSEEQRLRARSTLWYTAYAGSMLLNGILLTDTFLHMRQYIKSSQEY
ncbi:MAG: PEGA domain-containing protein [Spirochaetaceae bacterium]|nr:PEGA domain-containing protein [Spirochaetaceae bacterium]MCF7951193.1 PEGA domain-containing protein [Spirochaetaceae bacterium]